MADSRTNWEVGISGADRGKSLDYLRNVMCSNDVPSFHHVLVTFPGGVKTLFSRPLSLFGEASYASYISTINGMNAYVAEIKLMTELTGVCGPPPVCNPTCASSLCFVLESCLNSVSRHLPMCAAQAEEVG